MSGLREFVSSTKAGSGYCVLPGGLIFNWANVTVGVGGQVTATWAKPFPNACLSVQFAPVGTRGAATETNSTCTGFNNSGMTIYGGWTNTEQVYCFAIGW